MKPISRLIITILPFLCLLVAGPKAKAVVPPPDGGYPNFTTAEGTQALQSLTTGTGNTGVGWRALFADTTGSFNTGLGAGALVLNQADSNTAVGAVALLLNTSGTANVAVGTDALLSNDGGSNNTAVGNQALFSNIGNGTNAGNENTAMGSGALSNNVTSSNNTALGSSALSSSTGGDNTGIGRRALFNNIEGNGNTAVGDNTLFSNTSGGFNTALGFNAGGGVTTAHDVICIGALAAGENVDNSCYIAGIFNQTSAMGIPVLINSNSKLGTTTSSRRFKEAIKPMDQVSEELYALRPVTFRYKKEIDPAGTSQLGLVAEEVEKVNPDLVVRDNEGKAYSVRYDQVNAMLLNEFLKEHRKVEKLERTVEGLAAQLQKVTARIETNQDAAQVALSTQ